jgi:hypothetical protein
MRRTRPGIGCDVANLFDPPGRPFGYAWLEERTKIEDHVRKRTRYALRMDSPEFMFRVQKIQDRLHKYDPTFAERSRRWREDQAKRWRERGNSVDFTLAELEHLVEHFEGANDPISAEIGRKAREAIESR